MLNHDVYEWVNFVYVRGSIWQLDAMGSSVPDHLRAVLLAGSWVRNDLYDNPSLLFSRNLKNARSGGCFSLSTYKTNSIQHLAVGDM